MTAAHQVVAQAGARGPRFGLDAIDLARITQISLTPLSAATPAPVDLGLYFKFDEASGTAAADVSGNNNTGALLGSAAFAAGRFNNALSLDGIDGRVLIDNTAGLNLANALTLSAWLNPADLSGAYHTVAVNGAPNLRGYGMNIKAGALNFVKMTAADVTSTVAISTGTWQHVAITWDAASGEVKFYKNGVLAQTVLDAAALTAPLDADDLSVGSWLTGGSFFKGASTT